MIIISSYFLYFTMYHIHIFWCIVLIPFSSAGSKFHDTTKRYFHHILQRHWKHETISKNKLLAAQLYFIGFWFILIKLGPCVWLPDFFWKIKTDSYHQSYWYLNNWMRFSMSAHVIIFISTDIVSKTNMVVTKDHKRLVDCCFWEESEYLRHVFTRNHLDKFAEKNY